MNKINILNGEKQNCCWKRIIILACLLSGLYVLFIETGQWIRNREEESIGVFVIQGVTLFFIFFFLIKHFLFWRHNFISTNKKKRIDVAWETRVSEAKEYFIVLIVFSLLYLPAFLAVYPGVFGYDGPVQVDWFFSPEKLTAHHPLIHTFLLGLCFSLGNMLFQDYNIGLAVYSGLQGLVVCFIFAYTIIWMRKRNVCFYGRVLAILFLGLNPYIQLLNFSTTKDTLFSAFFLLVLLNFFDLLEQCNKSTIGRFVFSAILMCLFRNQGYYILFFCGLVTLLVFKKKKWNVSKTLFVSAIIGWFLMGPFIGILGIEKGDAREMFSLPMQQVAAVWKQNELGLTTLEKDDEKKIEKLITVDALEQYKTDFADPVKSGFQTNVLKKDLLGYIELYFKLGKEHTKSYIASFIYLVSGYWDIYYYGNNKFFDYGLMYTDTFPEVNICGIERNSLLQGYSQYLIDMVDDMERLPIIRSLFSQALPAWIMFFLLIASICEKKYNLGCVMMLLLGQWGIMLLSPVVVTRYALPLIVCVPILVMLAFRPDSSLSHEL